MSDLLDKAWKTLEGFPMSALSEDAMEAIVSLVIEAAAKVIEEGYDRKVDEPYRDDGKPSKNDKCVHNKYMYEDCEACAAAAIRSLLNKGE